MPRSVADGARPGAGATGSHAFFAALGLLIAGLAAAYPRFFASLVYDRSAIVRGEAWRLLTTHVVHAGGAHCLWNLSGLALVWMAFGPWLTGARWLAAGVASGLGSALGVLALHPEVRAMAGLSGVLHGLLAAGAAASIRAGSRLGWLVLGIVAAKVAWEQIERSSAASAALGGSLAFQAHLYGAITGLSFALLTGTTLHAARPPRRPRSS